MTTRTREITVTLHDLIEGYETFKRMKKKYNDTRDQMNEALDDLGKAAERESQLTVKLLAELDKKHGKKSKQLEELLVQQNEYMYIFMSTLYSIYFPEEFEQTFQDKPNSTWIHEIEYIPKRGRLK